MTEKLCIARVEKPDEIFSELTLRMVRERTHARLYGIYDELPGGMLMAFLWAAGNIVGNLKSESDNE